MSQSYSEGAPPGSFNFFEGGPERIDEVASAVPDVDYSGRLADEAAAIGGYAEQRAHQETAEKLGWMWKRGGSKQKSTMDIVLEGRRKNWQRRWFVVEGTNLEYYAHPNDRQLGIPPKGKVVLNDFRIQRGDVEHVAGYAKPSFALVSSSREFLLACDTDDERGGWIVHLQSILDKVVGRVAVADASVEKATEHYRQGNKHLLEQQDQLAIAEYTRSIGLNPAYEDAYYNRGIAYLNTGCNAALAITDFTQVIKMNPECSSAFNNRGISYKQLGKTVQAIEDYRQCLQIDPSDEYARKNLELCEQEEAAKSQSVRGMAGSILNAAMPKMVYGAEAGEMSGYVYRQTPQHFFAKRHLTVSGGKLNDNQDDQLLRGFSVEVSAIRKVSLAFDEPYCSTAPECEFQLQFGRQLIRLRALNPESRAQWIRALGGER